MGHTKGKVVEHAGQEIETDLGMMDEKLRRESGEETLTACRVGEQE